MPAARICKLARDRGIFSVIDAAHAPGMLPLDLAEVGADFYGGNGHKWMMAPAGTGFLHVRHDLRSLLHPLVTSWGWGFDRTKLDERTHGGATRWQFDLEFHGVVDRCAQIAMADAIEYLEGIGPSAIAARVRYLSDHARQRFAQTAGLVAATPTDPRLRGSPTPPTNCSFASTASRRSSRASASRLSFASQRGFSTRQARSIGWPMFCQR
jgi:isopenicillin-N epimerase